MNHTKTEMKHSEIHRKIMCAAAQLFLKRGYTNATVRDIADAAGVNLSAMIRTVGSKENLLCKLVNFVLEGQFYAAEKMLAGSTKDLVMLYAAETALQLYMAESDEAVRDLYSAAYSLPESSDLIRRAITEKLEQIFRAYLPGAQTKDFYELEIASGSIMRGYITVPCDMYFTIDGKVRRFLECSLRLYQVPEAKIAEAVAFVSNFDYPTIAKQTIDQLYSSLAQTKDLAPEHDE